MTYAVIFVIFVEGADSRMKRNPHRVSSHLLNIIFCIHIYILSVELAFENIVYNI